MGPFLGYQPDFVCAPTLRFGRKQVTSEPALLTTLHSGICLALCLRVPANAFALRVP